MNSSSTDRKEIRKFGLIAFLFFGSLCAIGLWRQKVLPVYLFGFLSTLGMGFVLLPDILRPVYETWVKFAHFMNGIVTAVVLTIAYYLIMTPSAFIKRLYSGRPLPISPDKNVSSYWVAREEPVQPKERFIKRY